MLLSPKPNRLVEDSLRSACAQQNKRSDSGDHVIEEPALLALGISQVTVTLGIFGETGRVRVFFLRTLSWHKILNFSGTTELSMFRQCHTCSAAL